MEKTEMEQTKNKKASGRDLIVLIGAKLLYG